VQVLRHRRARWIRVPHWTGEGEIVSVERGTVGQISCPENGGCRRIWHVLVATGKLIDDSFGRYASERRFPQVWRIGNWVACLVDLLCLFDDLLDLHGARRVIDDRRLIPE